MFVRRNCASANPLNRARSINIPLRYRLCEARVGRSGLRNLKRWCGCFVSEMSFTGKTCWHKVKLFLWPHSKSELWNGVYNIKLEWQNPKPKMLYECVILSVWQVCDTIVLWFYSSENHRNQRFRSISFQRMSEHLQTPIFEKVIALQSSGTQVSHLSTKGLIIIPLI